MVCVVARWKKKCTEDKAMLPNTPLLVFAGGVYLSEACSLIGR